MRNRRKPRAIALCTYLSAVLLVGLVLNSLFNWSWADPIAALVIAAIAVREGVNAWKGDPCYTRSQHNCVLLAVLLVAYRIHSHT